MIEYNNVDHNFLEYLNRYCTGIIFLRTKLKSISMKYELAEAFSNHSCRFILDVDFLDFENLSNDEKILANKHFHNSQNSTGNGFVSFIYKSQRSYGVDIEKVQSFVLHYEFAKHILKGTIKNIIPQNCLLEIKNLSEEPLFIYMDRFFSGKEYSLHDRLFEKKYAEEFKTSFDFDIFYHLRILTQASRFLGLTIENAISDKDLQQNYSRSIEELRQFVLENNIPFTIQKHTNTIDKIYIDASALKDKLNKIGLPKYSQLQKNIIIKEIDNKQHEKEVRNIFLAKLIKESKLSIGDLILINENDWEKKCFEIGIVKGFEANYTANLVVKYNQLKNNLEESKISLKTIDLKKIADYIPSSHLKNLDIPKPSKTKEELFIFLKKNARKL